MLQQQRRDNGSMPQEKYASALQVYKMAIDAGVNMPPLDQFLYAAGVHNGDEDRPFELASWQLQNIAEQWQAQFNDQIRALARGKALAQQYNSKVNAHTDDQAQYQKEQQQMQLLENQVQSGKKKEVIQRIKDISTRQQESLNKLIDKTIDIAQKQEKLSTKQQQIAQLIQNQLKSTDNSLLKYFFSDSTASQALKKMNDAIRSFTSNELGYMTRIGKVLNAIDPLSDKSKLVFINQLLNNNTNFMNYLLSSGVIDKIPSAQGDRLYNLSTKGMSKKATQLLGKIIQKKTPRSVAKVVQVLRQKVIPSSDDLVTQKAIFQGLGKRVPADLGLNKGLKDGAFLQSFPHWATGQAKKANRIIDNAKKMDAYITGYNNRNAPVYEDLARLGGVKAHFNEQTGRWQGSNVDKYFNKALRSAQSYSKRLQRGQQMIAGSITIAQIQKQVPQFVKDIVSANSNLSKYGFGAISKNSSNLYAGRWLDQGTGKVRLLPPADLKYINPASRPQKLGYLQAKIINHWNELVSTNSEYQRLLEISDQKYTNRAVRSVQNGLQIRKNYISFVNYINSVIETYFSTKSFGGLDLAITPQYSAKKSLLAQVGGAQLRVIYDIIPEKVDQKTSKISIQKMRKKISKWTQAIFNAYNTLSSRVAQQRFTTPQQQLKLTNSLTSAYLAFVGFIGRRVNNALNKARKIATISNQVTVPQLYGMEEKIKSQNKQFKQSMIGITGLDIPSSGSATLSILGKSLASNLRGGSYSVVLDQIEKYKKNQQFLKGKTSIVPTPVRKLDKNRFQILNDNFDIVNSFPKYAESSLVKNSERYYQIKRQRQIENQAAAIKQKQAQQAFLAQQKQDARIKAAAAAYTAQQLRLQQQEQKRLLQEQANRQLQSQNEYEERIRRQVGPLLSAQAQNGQDILAASPYLQSLFQTRPILRSQGS